MVSERKIAKQLDEHRHVFGFPTQFWAIGNRKKMRKKNN